MDWLFAVPLIMLRPKKAVSVEQLTKNRANQFGINMVDLMMWIAIATLMIATALQGITYYQKNAYIYQMKNDVTHAAEVVSAKAAINDGKFTAQTVSEGSSDTTKSGDVVITPDSGAADAVGYVLRGTHPGVTDLDVLYLSKQRGGYAPGIHVVPKGTLIAPDGATTIDSGAGTGDGTGSTPKADASAVMTTVWDTRLTYKNFTMPEPTSCANLIVPLTGSVNVVIDWGDGTAPEPFTSIMPSHTYTDTGGLKTVKITGTFTGWVGQDEPYWADACLTEVTSWGDGTNTSDVTSAFGYATALTDVARLPKTITNQTTNMFQYATAFTGESVKNWDVSNLTSMEYMFIGNEAFHGDVSKWDVSNVTSMAGLFAESSFNGDLSNWDVSNVTDLTYMFGWNTAFNGDISKWDVRKVESTSSMFQCATFNGDISEWKTYSLTDMYGMFVQNKSFNTNIGNWDTSHVTNMAYVFNGATSFDQDISRWDVSKVTSMQSAFQGAQAFRQDISGWDVSSVTNMYNMLFLTSSFDWDLTGWDVSAVTTHDGFDVGSLIAPEHLPTFPSP